MFRPLVKQCCWHVPTPGKKEVKFDSFVNIIRLFWTVVDAEAVYSTKNGVLEAKFDEKVAKKYFSTLFKRQEKKK